MTSLTSEILLNAKKDFPFFKAQEANGINVHYLDSAATTQKPACVVDAMTRFLGEEYSTVRRGVYSLSAKTTQLYEEAREKAGKLLGAASSDEIIFTSGTTQSINLVAYSYGRHFIKTGDEIIISGLEHHANITPWQMVCEETGAVLKVIPVHDNGELDIEAYQNLLNSKTKLVAVNHISNAIGTVNPVKEIIDLAHKKGAIVLIDGAQSVPHLAIDVQELNADFYVFSGHKIYGPTGIGILYGKKALLEKMPPYQRGGDMIEEVTFEKTTFLPPPHRFEAGTPPIAEIIGLGAAIDYINSLGFENIHRHEQQLLDYGTEQLLQIPGLRLIGTSPNKGSILSFAIKGIHAHDIGTLLDEKNVVIRSGHHCAQPIMKRFGVSATARASMGIYNTKEDMNALAEGLKKTIEIFS